MHLVLSQRTLNEESRPSFCAGRKLGKREQALLLRLLQDDPQCPSRVLLDKATRSHWPIPMSIRHLNRWRATCQRNRHTGRPRRVGGQWPVAAETGLVKITPHVSGVGVHLFAQWLEQHGVFDRVVSQLTQAIATHQRTHPGDDFPLRHHRLSTLKRRVQALFFAPLFGIQRLSAFDTRAHGLESLRGRG